ncbi:putative membrane protein YiaA [Actinoplanes lutulentus]|uniref:Uncharacterized protein n=1 Tax=Actinoplanes lutulentus TaxID=1287878 RepID=A0A327ZD23_9ACTN|nr:hypothetical protein [Actinoplanes lutulentus]MBB2947351.1 putative membrane protein YiaA [Actinoplanes lutulentus]RAK36626.1 hypothetical protein B0I29_108216 [Actinoplanes lutulentus]
MLFVDARGRRIDTARILGSIALGVGILVAVIGLVVDSVPAEGYFFAGMLVFAGIGLRLEAAVGDRR